MRLLTLHQVKMLKAQKLGYLSACLNLSPATKYKGLQTCPYAGECKKTCLQFAGRNRFDGAAFARVRRTRQYVDNPDAFYTDLIHDIESLIRKAEREHAIPTVRLNCLSDIRWEDDNVLGTGKNIFELYPGLQFIDYTKDYTRYESRLPSNYHLTYSVNELTPAGIEERVFSLGYNCAVVFERELPTTHNGRPVISGDDHDLRHLDPRGAYVGLKFKRAFSRKTGRAIAAARVSRFVVLQAD